MGESSEGHKPTLRERLFGKPKDKTHDMPKFQTDDYVTELQTDVKMAAKLNMEMFTGLINQTISNYETRKKNYDINNDTPENPNYYRLNTAEEWKEFIKKRGWKTQEDTHNLDATDIKKLEMISDTIQLKEWCYYQVAQKIDHGEININTFDAYKQASNNLYEQIIPKSASQTPTE